MKLIRRGIKRDKEMKIWHLRLWLALAPNSSTGADRIESSFPSGQIWSFEVCNDSFFIVFFICAVSAIFMVANKNTIILNKYWQTGNQWYSLLNEKITEILANPSSV